jgi:hypothetical protein
LDIYNSASAAGSGPLSGPVRETAQAGSNPSLNPQYWPPERSMDIDEEV